MPKHGEGMDLFEFIDLEPAVDEALACCIFSQVSCRCEHVHVLLLNHILFVVPVYASNKRHDLQA